MIFFKKMNKIDFFKCIINITIGATVSKTSKMLELFYSFIVSITSGDEGDTSPQQPEDIWDETPVDPSPSTPSPVIVYYEDHKAWPVIGEHETLPPPPGKEEMIFDDEKDALYKSYLEGSEFEQHQKWSTQRTFPEIKFCRVGPRHRHQDQDKDKDESFFVRDGLWYHCGSMCRVEHFFDDPQFILVDTSDKWPFPVEIGASWGEPERIPLVEEQYGDSSTPDIIYKWCVTKSLWYSEFWQEHDDAFYDTDRSIVRKYWHYDGDAWVLEK
jgi:hypothetical protein